jgi:hypothetical protein
MSSRLFAVAVLLVVPPALCAAPSEEAGEPAASARMDWNPEEAVAAILRSDLTAAQKARGLAKYVRIGDDPMVVAGRLGHANAPAFQWLRVKPNSSGALNFSSGLVIVFANGKVTAIWTNIPGRKDEAIADER